tara:strand:+ start:936 stop:1097 length:162 start_codon:yes stop_codon:yes gene_type:complete
MKKGMLYLVIAIPLAAVLMGVITLYVAFSSPNQAIDKADRPLSKTSWQEEQAP